MIGFRALAPTNSIWYKVLYSYLPIAVTMAAEPIIVSITSRVCMLVPYTLLAKKASCNPTALTLDFDQSPPHFQFIRSIRARHLPLTALNIAIFLCNVLAIVLAGHFSETSMSVDVHLPVETFPTPNFSGFTVPRQDMYYALAEYFNTSAYSVQFEIPWTTPEYYILPYHLINSTRDVMHYRTPTLGISLKVECSLVPAKDITFRCGNPGCGASSSSKLDYSLVVNDPCWDYRPGNYSWKGLSHDNIIRSSNCSNMFFPIWVEQPWNLDPKNGNIYKNHLEAVIMNCTTIETVVELETIGDMNDVRVSELRRNFSQEEIKSLYTPGGAQLATTFNKIVIDGIQAEKSFDSHKIRWLNSLMRTWFPSIVRTDRNMTHLPNMGFISHAFTTIYARLFLVSLSQAAQDIIDLGTPETIITQGQIRADGVHMQLEMVIITLLMIGGIMVLLLFVYYHCWQPVGYVPLHLAGMYALLYASNAKEECGKLRGRNPAERAAALGDFKGTYMCGRFGGDKNDTHYGVHRTGSLENSGTELESLET